MAENHTEPKPQAVLLIIHPKITLVTPFTKTRKHSQFIENVKPEFMVFL